MAVFDLAEALHGWGKIEEDLTAGIGYFERLMVELAKAESVESVYQDVRTSFMGHDRYEQTLRDTGIDRQKIPQVIMSVVQGSPDNAKQLLDLLVEPILQEEDSLPSYKEESTVWVLIGLVRAVNWLERRVVSFRPERNEFAIGFSSLMLRLIKNQVNRHHHWESEPRRSRSSIDLWRMTKSSQWQEPLDQTMKEWVRSGLEKPESRRGELATLYRDLSTYLKHCPLNPVGPDRVWDCGDFRPSNNRVSNVGLCLIEALAHGYFGTFSADDRLHSAAKLLGS